MPAELTERFTFDSCVKRQDGRELYFVTQKSDGLRAVLRITDTGSGESVAVESAVLAKLNHPAIPKTFGAGEHNGRGYVLFSYTRVTSLMPLVNPFDPVTVHCTGLPAEVLNKVRDLNGIILFVDPPATP